MTEITIYGQPDKNNKTICGTNIYKVEIKNHSELKELCNAISTLSYSLGNYVWKADLKNNRVESDSIEINTEHFIDKEKGVFVFEIKRGISDNIRIAFDFFFLSIQMLIASYPDMIKLKLKQGNRD